MDGASRVDAGRSQRWTRAEAVVHLWPVHSSILQSLEWGGSRSAWSRRLLPWPRRACQRPSGLFRCVVRRGSRHQADCGRAWLQFRRRSSSAEGGGRQPASASCAAV